MPITATCAACNRTIKAKDELAGARVKCPGCGKTVTIPANSSAGSPVATDEDNGSSEQPERRKRKKRRGGRSRSAEPIFSMMGIEFTPKALVVTGGLTVLMLVGVVLLFVLTPMGLWFSSAPEVRVVDVYTAVNGMRYTDVGERVLQKQSAIYTIPGHRRLLVTKETPDGGYLQIKVRIPHKQSDAYFAGSRGAVTLMGPVIQLKCGSEALEPVYVTDRSDPAVGFHMGYNPPKESGAKSLREYLGPGQRAENSWTHDGELKEDGDSLRFEGKHGMKVTTQMGDVLKDLTGGTADLGKGLDATPLVGGPSGYVKVTWDPASTGFLVAREVERPNDISLSWEVTCIFQRPKGSKDATLEVLGKAYQLKLP
jgi:hypothetical protein